MHKIRPLSKKHSLAQSQGVGLMKDLLGKILGFMLCRRSDYIIIMLVGP